jgi:hypothetical protein
MVPFCVINNLAKEKYWFLGIGYIKPIDDMLVERRIEAMITTKVV